MSILRPTVAPAEAGAAAPLVATAPGSLRRLLSHRSAQLGLTIFGIVIVLSAIGPAFTQNPDATNYADRLAAPSHLHWLGTDDAGRDELARTLAGGRASLAAALLVFAITLVAGIAVGAAAGYLGGVVDLIISRVIDVLLGLPTLIVALAIVGVLGPGFWNLVAAMSFCGWAYLARLCRSYVMTNSERPDVIAARMAGVGQLKIAVEHVIPGAVVLVLVAATVSLGDVIVSLAGLSFLGLGAQPPTAEWGNMLSEGQSLLSYAPWLLIGPGVGIVLSVAGATLLSDALRDITDPAGRR
jgi:nickel transport system permease protein